MIGEMRSWRVSIVDLVSEHRELMKVVEQERTAADGEVSAVIETDNATQIESVRGSNVGAGTASTTAGGTVYSLQNSR